MIASNDVYKEPGYVAALKLQHWPFSPEGFGEHFYADSVRAELLHKLKHLIEYTHLTLFVQGVDGVGKTTLLEQLSFNSKESWRICKLDAAQKVGEEVLLKNIADAFQLGYHFADTPLTAKSLLDQIDILAQNDYIPIIFVDNVEDCTRNCADLLIKLNAPTYQSALRITLFGSDLPSLLAQYWHADEEQSDLQVLPLTPFSEDGTRNYILQKLINAGHTQVKPFNEDNINAIHQQSEGIPANINRLADTLMQSSIAKSKTKPSLKKAKSKKITTAGSKNSRNEQISALKIISASLVLVLMISFFFFSGEDVQQPVEKTSTGQQPVARTTPQSETPEEPIFLNELNKEKQQVTDETDFAASIMESPDNIQAKPLPKPKKNDIQQAQTIAPATVVVQNEDQTETRKVINSAPKDPLAPPISTKQLASLMLKNPAAKQKPVEPVSGIPGYRKESWLLEQDPKNYTLQLLGASAEEAVTEFIERYGLKNESAYFHTMRKDKDWYSLVYGIYPSRASALEAAKKLPKNVVKGDPWVRRFEGIHTDILTKQ